MTTLLLRLAGPMQSWGTSSRFDRRDTGKEPGKSGVLGLLAAALGIERENWAGDLKSLSELTMGVRHDRPGVIKKDYQTAGAGYKVRMIQADGKRSSDGIVSERFYLADATFLVGLAGEDKELLERAHAALKNPVWPLALGRKSYVPSDSVWMEDAVQEGNPKEVLMTYRWIANFRRGEKSPEKLLLSLDSKEGFGLLRMDQPLSSFAERRFGSRFVTSEWIPCPKEATLVSE